MTHQPIVIEQTYIAPIDRVWKALTEKDQMKHWYFNLSEFKPEVGFEFTFEAGKDEKKYVHVCKVTEVVLNEKLAYSWRYEGYEGNSAVTFELFNEGLATRLKLTHEGLETFQAGNPDFSKENFLQGWTYITGTSLANFLAEQGDVTV